MKHRVIFISLFLLTLGNLLFVRSTWAATHEKVLHNFDGTNGSDPNGPLVCDAAGNLYGTTEDGGNPAGGTAFELSPNGSGGWTETVLHSFGAGRDGKRPSGSLVLDAAGNLYGLTAIGGIYAAGTVFELSPIQGGGWTETVLHSFDSMEGDQPGGTLAIDHAGNLYGTTGSHGLHRAGTAFELSPNQDGTWTETTLHSFGGGRDGVYPSSGLVSDVAGNLYGTTSFGGIHQQGCLFEDFTGCGTIFELSPRQGGGWTEMVLHSFDNVVYPGALVFDTAGNLYGITWEGGIHGYGTVFELLPNQDGGWTETTLHSFGRGTDGKYPSGGLVFDGAGNLYGTTAYGGIHCTNNGGLGCGTAFELSPREGGGWTETVLHSFGNDLDGAFPTAGLTFDYDNNLYGTTGQGGVHGDGTVFMITTE